MQHLGEAGHASLLGKQVLELLAGRSDLLGQGAICPFSACLTPLLPEGAPFLLSLQESLIRFHLLYSCSLVSFLNSLLGKEGEDLPEMACLCDQRWLKRWILILKEHPLVTRETQTQETALCRVKTAGLPSLVLSLLTASTEVGLS